jgi:redox-sensitive bicupin YhaK (pirin superfamily)
MLEMVIDNRPHDLGSGFTVRRILPFHSRRMVGPFIFLDHAGPLDLPGEARRKADVRPHPHIGLATVSYLFDGQITHRDSLGVEQVIVPGEVNWMTAGRGISHSERLELPPSGEARPIELIQSWCALPETDEEVEPAFANYAAGDLPVADADGVWMRLIAGAAYGLKSPVAVRSPLFYLHVALKPSAEIKPPAEYAERGAYIAKGRVEVDGRVYEAGQLLVFGGADDPAIRALDDATLMVFGGEKLGERHIWWNFVSSRKERIEQAKADWKAGRIKLPPNDNKEFIPLPE